MFVTRFQIFEKCLLASSSLSVRPHEKSRLPLEGFFMEFDIWVFFETVYREQNFR